MTQSMLKFTGFLGGQGKKIPPFDGRARYGALSTDSPSVLTAVHILGIAFDFKLDPTQPSFPIISAFKARAQQSFYPLTYPSRIVGERHKPKVQSSCSHAYSSIKIDISALSFNVPRTSAQFEKLSRKAMMMMISQTLTLSFGSMKG